MKFVIVLASVLCLAIANIQAVVTLDPNTQTYRIDQV